jgi:hypothetical protein
VPNISYGTNGTVAHEGAETTVREVLRPKTSTGEEIFVGLLHHGVAQAAIPFAPSR